MEEQLRIRTTATIARDQAEKLAHEAVELSKAIAPLLAGKDPGLQGATLADLLATWLVGHRPPEFRGMLLQMHMATVLDLVDAESARRGE